MTGRERGDRRFQRGHGVGGGRIRTPAYRAGARRVAHVQARGIVQEAEDGAGARGTDELSIGSMLRNRL